MEEEAKERKKSERRAREKEAAYQERLRYCFYFPSKFFYKYYSGLKKIILMVFI